MTYALALAPAQRPRTRMKPAERRELEQHPFHHIPGVAFDAYGRTVIDLPALTNRDEAWEQGAKLGLQMLDAYRECDGVNHRPAPAFLLKAVFANMDNDRAAFDRGGGFIRVLEMALDGYMAHRDHRHDAPFVIGLERAWRDLTGGVVS